MMSTSKPVQTIKSGQMTVKNNRLVLVPSSGDKFSPTPLPNMATKLVLKPLPPGQVPGGPVSRTLSFKLPTKFSSENASTSQNVTSSTGPIKIQLTTNGNGVLKPNYENSLLLRPLSSLANPNANRILTNEKANNGNSNSLKTTSAMSAVLSSTTSPFIAGSNRLLLKGHSQSTPSLKDVAPGCSSPIPQVPLSDALSDLTSSPPYGSEMYMKNLQAMQASPSYFERYPTAISLAESRDMSGTPGVAKTITLARENQSNTASNLPIFYFSADDAYMEENVGGLVVGANSSQNMAIAELPSINTKKAAIVAKGSRKPCNCTRSMCLKLYCECFANGEFCKNCNCTNCKNVMGSEHDRSRAIKSCLERNPAAFQPKIGKGRADTDRLHNKGCNCKRSSCLKNYCECYEAKVACTIKCKCVGCRNTEGDRQSSKFSKFGSPFGASSYMSSYSGLLPRPTSGASSNLDYPSGSRPHTPGAAPAESATLDIKKMPWFYMNDDVIQAAALCLVAQGEQLETRFDGREHSQEEIEASILKEFGVCLQQIIKLTASFN